MNLCVCSESRNRWGFAFAYSSAIATLEGLLPSGWSRIVGLSAKRLRCSSGTRSSTISFASFARAAMRGSTRSFGETQSQTSDGSSVKIVPFDSMWTRRPSSAQRLDQRRCLGLRERLAASENHHRAVAPDLADLCDDFADACEELRRVIRVAKVAGEIAAGQAHEHRRSSRPSAFALNGVEDLAELKHLYVLLSPSRRSLRSLLRMTHAFAPLTRSGWPMSERRRTAHAVAVSHRTTSSSCSSFASSRFQIQRTMFSTVGLSMNSLRC